MFTCLALDTMRSLQVGQPWFYPLVLSLFFKMRECKNVHRGRQTFLKCCQDKSKSCLQSPPKDSVKHE